MEPIDAAKTAVEAALAELTEMPPVERFRAAGPLSELLSTQAARAARLRASAAAQLRDEQRLTYEQLAAMLGVSLQRAAQLVKAAAAK